MIYEIHFIHFQYVEMISKSNYLCTNALFQAHLVDQNILIVSVSLKWLLGTFFAYRSCELYKVDAFDLLVAIFVWYFVLLI